MGVLELALIAAALLIGATGTFSPCGFSAVETIGTTGHSGGRRTTYAACATFFPGAILGGVITFGALAWLGELMHGAGGDVAYGVAAVPALVAAALEVRGTRIVPQIRRQLPENWRRLMPMPVAAALYGVLLGLGFTTFVLSFGVWALAAISIAVGDPAIGVLLGAAFGVGRAVPVVALAPLAGTPAGARATDWMASDPRAYLGVRRGDAAALLLVAVALGTSAGDAGAAQNVSSGGSDPSATADAVVFERGGQGFLRGGTGDLPLPGSDPAIGGPYAAALSGDTVRLLDRGSLQPVAQVAAPGADALAVSAGWLAYRAKLANGGDGIFARNITNPGAPGPVQTLHTIGAPSQLSPPSLDGATMVYAVASPRKSRVVLKVLGTRKKRTLVKSGRALLFNPSIKGRSFAYTLSRKKKSRLMIRSLKRSGLGRPLMGLKRKRGIVWSTALTEGRAYVTVLRPSATNPGSDVVVVSTRKGNKKKKGKKRRKGP